MPYTNCERCAPQVTSWQLDNQHYNLDQCCLSRDHWYIRKTLQQSFEAIQVTIEINLDLLKSSAKFPYLGHTIAYYNSYWRGLYHNLSKLQRRWCMVSRFLVKMRVTVRVRETLYKLVVQTVLLYGSDRWIITDAMIKVL